MLKIALSILASLVIAVIAGLLFAEPPSNFQTEMIITVSVICGIIIILCFVLSEITDNYSQTDKLWSIAPVIYTWVMTLMADFNPRLILMSVLITIWGIRLSYNFGRMGGYSLKFWTGHEDYRWRIVRSKPGLKHPIVWKLFNFFFISAYQNILILLITIPVAASFTENNKALNFYDWLIAGIILLLIVMETVADQQQWNFQKEKKRWMANNETLTDGYEKGFVHKGLWALSRHPNYFAEQAVWVMIFLFSVNASGNLGNFSIIGCLLLIILFQGSSFLSEQISSGKYPAYTEYKKKTGKFFPKLFR
jgi:steroid 5-alpha reductase family enzyme